MRRLFIGVLLVAICRAAYGQQTLIQIVPGPSDIGCTGSYRFALFANNTTGKLKACENGTAKDLIGGGGASPGGSGTELQFRNGTALGAVTGSSVSGADITVGGKVIVAAGSAAAPSLTFANSLGSGIYGYDANALGIASSNGGLAAIVYNQDFNMQHDIAFPSNGNVIFTNGTATGGSRDVSLSRISAGTVGVGNPSAGGSTAGTLVSTVSKLVPVVTPPTTCNAGAEGSIYADTSHALCYCNGTAWAVINGAGTCT